jgi:hypothetical protein
VRRIRVWIAEPSMVEAGEGSVELGYYENGRSSAIWRCSVRRASDRWLVDACDMHTIS